MARILELTSQQYGGTIHVNADHVTYWIPYSDTRGTMLFFMGITHRLIEHGKREPTPPWASGSPD
jgi:hypothetical protein